MHVVDARGIAPLLDRQFGLVTRRQLLGLGWGRGAIAHALRTGWLHRVHDGVFSVDARLSPHARWLAATLATGGVLSHVSAAALHGLIRDRTIDVEISKTSSLKPRQGIVVHRPRDLPPGDVMSRSGIRTTTPTRTIVDLAETLDQWRVLDVAHEALHRKVLDVDRLRRQPLQGRKGAASLTALLQRLADREHSALESALKTLCEHAGLPAPTPQYALSDRHHADLAWPDRQLLVEADSWTFHGNQRQWQRDHDRDLTAATKGWRTIRITHAQVHDQPANVIAAPRAALAAP